MTRFAMNRAALSAVLLFLILLLAAPVFPQSAPDLTALIQPNRQQGRPMQALYQVQAHAAQYGWTAQHHHIAGDLWQAVGEMTQALPHWEAALSQQPDDAALLRQVAQSNIDLQRWPQAVDTLSQLAEVATDTRWAHFQLGLIRAPFDPLSAIAHLEVAGRSPAYSQTTEQLLTVLRRYQDDPLVSMQAGFVLVSAELWPYAELAFTHAADIGRPYAEALAYLGYARMQQGKSSHDWMMQALTLEPENAVVQFLAGMSWREQDDYPQSLQAFITAVALNPLNPAYYAELSTAYRLVNDLANAEHWLRMALEISEGDPRFQRLLAAFYADEAYNLEVTGLNLLENSTLMLPNDPDVRASFGWALYRMNETTSALEQLEAALRIAPDHARALYYKAQILLESGETEAAIPLLERVIERNADHAEEARRLLNGLTP
jgi:tetratricopeptide (TPR) repeat protein